jgi:hypothetical protein
VSTTNPSGDKAGSLPVEEQLAAVQASLTRMRKELEPYLTGRHALPVVEHVVGELGELVAGLKAIKADVEKRVVGVPMAEQLKQIEAQIRGAAVEEWQEKISGRNPNLPEQD